MKTVAAFFRASPASRAQALEAVALLALARLLVDRVPIRRWHLLLDTSVGPDAGAAVARTHVARRTVEDAAGPPERHGSPPVMGSVTVAGRPGERAGVPERIRSVRTARQVTRIVRKVADHAPFRAVCLPRAMAAQWMLRRRRIPSRLDFGTRRGEDGALEFHAWLSVAGETVMGGREARTYTAFERPGEAARRPGRAARR